MSSMQQVSYFRSEGKLPLTLTEQDLDEYLFEIDHGRLPEIQQPAGPISLPPQVICISEDENNSSNNSDHNNQEDDDGLFDNHDEMPNSFSGSQEENAVSNDSDWEFDADIDSATNQEDTGVIPKSPSSSQERQEADDDEYITRRPHQNFPQDNSNVFDTLYSGGKPDKFESNKQVCRASLPRRHQKNATRDQIQTPHIIHKRWIKIKHDIAKLLAETSKEEASAYLQKDFGGDNVENYFFEQLDGQMKQQMYLVSIQD